MLAIERHALAAWPGTSQTRIGGWLLNFGGGHTKRANSATLLDPSVGKPIDAIESIVAAYQQCALPAIFRITPLAVDSGVDDYLRLHNYTELGETFVQTMSFDQARFESASDVVIEGAASPQWRLNLAQAHGLAPEAARMESAILDCVKGQLLCASVVEKGVMVALGMGVLSDELLGLFNIITLPESRGRGVGGRLVRGLLAAGQARGARGAYLQVTAENAVAIGLYARIGFADSYRYHYRRRG